MAIAIDKRLSAIVDSVAQEIVSTEHFGSGSLIKVPIMYPSGASVVAQITQHQNRFFVTDMGMGFQEAEMLGGSGYYTRGGRALAEHFGIRFDNQAFFVAEASREQLAAAVTVVANCSSEAAALSAYRVAERRFAEDADALYMRLSKVFPKDRIARDVDFAGSSNHKWHVAAVVSHKDRKAVFEPVNKHHTSVVFASAKFHDIARLEHPPNRIAVVKDKSELGNYLNVLAQSATVVEYRSPDETIRRVAA